jgi:hypothetical protein
MSTVTPPPQPPNHTNFFYWDQKRNVRLYNIYQPVEMSFGGFFNCTAVLFPNFCANYKIPVNNDGESIINSLEHNGKVNLNGRE